MVEGSAYDVVVIGAGAAGLTAALYTGRKKLKTLVVVGPHPGGETTLTNDIRNYPGYEQGPGPDLMKVFEKQAKTYPSVEFLSGSVKKVEKNGNAKLFTIQLADGKSVESKTVILSYGRERRKLSIPGEEEWMGKGVSTCTTCDAPLFGNKTVVIIGGGNSAIEGALDAASYASKVYIVHRREGFRADPITVDKAKGNNKIEFLQPYKPKEIKGDKFVTEFTVTHSETGEEKSLKVDGVFIEIGYETNVEMIKGLVETAKNGEIIIDIAARTKTPGLYSAGDLTITPYKQTVISAGLGATAALEAYKYISGAEDVQDIAHGI